MSSLNKVTLIGNVGADPEVKSFQGGGQIVNLKLATSESWKDKSTGERVDKTEWHNIVVKSEGLCKVVSQYVKKGTKLYIEGKLETRKWKDKDGNDRYNTEIVLNGFSSNLVILSGIQKDNADEDIQKYHKPAQRQANNPNPSWAKNIDDDIPF